MNKPSALLQARYRGDLDEVRRLRSSAATLSMFEACAIGETLTVRDLLSQPSAHAQISADGFTPLQLASFFGHLDIVLMLLEANADPNQFSANAMRLQALHSAVAGGHLEVASALIAAGADINAEQHGGYTPLMAAQENQHSGLVALLETHGATRPA